MPSPKILQKQESGKCQQIGNWPHNMQYLKYYKDYFSKFKFCNKFPIFDNKYHDNYCQISNRLQQAMFPLPVLVKNSIVFCIKSLVTQFILKGYAWSLYE